MAKRPLRIAFFIFLAIGLFLFIGVLMTTWVVEDGSLGEGRIALIRIEGIILDSKAILDEIQRYDDNPTVKAIVIRIDSPGGAVVPSQEIYEKVKQIRGKAQKKVVTSMGTLAASGGYYIASASDRIVANPGTLTGSIGVIMEMANVTGLFEKIGVESVVIKTGKYKDIGSPFRRMKAEEREILQNVLDDVHSQFIEAVSESRAMEISQVRSIADGRIFTGRQAHQLGLVDELGTLEDTIDLTAKMVGIEGKPRVLETKKRFSFFDLIRNQWLGAIIEPLRQPKMISIQYLLSL